MSEIAIITPSMIGNRVRAALAAKAQQSLSAAVGAHYPWYVADDVPRFGRKGLRWLPRFGCFHLVHRVYDAPSVHVRRSWRKRGSRQATLDALRCARAAGAKYVFLHLDDNVYLPNTLALTEFAAKALREVPELMQVKLTDHPIMGYLCTPEKGNRTLLRISDDQVAFEAVTLRPRRFENFTLWWTELAPSMCGEIWVPISLWSVLFRAEFLERVLTHPLVAESRHLADVEVTWKNPANLQVLLGEQGARTGYINMQFCGFEMHQNPNWESFMEYPNEPVI